MSYRSLFHEVLTGRNVRVGVEGGGGGVGVRVSRTTFYSQASARMQLGRGGAVVAELKPNVTPPRSVRWAVRFSSESAAPAVAAWKALSLRWKSSAGRRRD